MNKVALVEEEVLFNGGDERAANALVFCGTSRDQDKAQDKAAELAAQGKQQMSEYVDRGKEYYDRGRTQWAQYVEKGKGLVQEQQDKVSAAIDAGENAYASTTTGDQSS